VLGWVGAGARQIRLDRKSERFQAIDHLVQRVFADLHSGANDPYELLDDILDAAINVEKIFLHTALSTGSKTVIYHGDDTRTPNNIRYEKGRALIGNQFDKLDPAILDASRREINELFPEIIEFAKDDKNTKDTAYPMLMLLLTLIDILTSIRTNSRLILFNPKPFFYIGTKYLPAKKYKDLQAFYNLFENTSGRIISPSGTHDLAGLNKNEFFGSPQFHEYCKAHNLLNYIDGDSSKPLSKIASTIVSLTDRYDRFVEERVMNFAIAKGLGRLADWSTFGISGHAMDFFELISRFCKEYQRNICVYSGSNLEEYCSQLVMKDLFSTTPPRSAGLRASEAVASAGLSAWQSITKALRG
jgi:hypothetical protein